MHTTSLRKVGGSIMLAVPPAILEILRLRAGETVGLTVDGERLVVFPKPRNKPKYSLDELLAQCDADIAMSHEDREWSNAPPTGRKL